MVSVTYGNAFKNIDKKSNCEMILHYNSSRKGLYPWIKGMLGCIAKEFFKTEIQFKIITSTTDNNKESRFRQHMVIIIQSKNEPHAGSLTDLDKSISNNFRPKYPHKSLVNARHMVNFLPYHIIFDSMLYVRQSGYMLQKICEPLKDEQQDVVSLAKIASLIIPAVPFDSVSIRRFINSAFTFLLYSNFKTLSSDAESGILLRGQICFLEDNDCFLFIGSPRIMTLLEMEEKNLFLSDIPLYHVTRELLLVNQQRLAEMEISKHLNEMTNQLQKTTSLLEEEKARVNMLLSQMLPAKVAQQLLSGKKVEAEKFQMCTILFSDIVTFTNIASQCNPMDVINMLNALYSLFDKASEDNGAYKVETIGDAYMVVAGVPDVTIHHSGIIAEQAMDMVAASGKVKSPVNGKSLQIRVGIHSGPVVAGVVGDKMPRFCLFGDTVNVASRMESHGMPGRIHCSDTSYQFLVNQDYTFEGRGEVEIKGKGLMKTFFLLGRTQSHKCGERFIFSAANTEIPSEKDCEKPGNGELRDTEAGSVIQYTKPIRSVFCALV